MTVERTFKFSELERGSLSFLRRFAASMEEPAAFWRWLQRCCEREGARRETGGAEDVSAFPKLSLQDAAIVRNEMAVLADKINFSTDDVFVGLVAEMGLEAAAQVNDNAGSN